VVLEHRAVHVEDVLADPNYKLKEQRTIGGYRTALGVPLIREGSSIGVVILSRSAVKPFTDKQIELVTTFADRTGTDHDRPGRPSFLDPCDQGCRR
jgi:GAF domain-containing protein